MRKIIVYGAWDDLLCVKFVMRWMWIFIGCGNYYDWWHHWHQSSSILRFLLCNNLYVSHIVQNDSYNKFHHAIFFFIFHLSPFIFHPMAIILHTQYILSPIIYHLLSIIYHLSSIIISLVVKYHAINHIIDHKNIIMQHATCNISYYWPSHWSFINHTIYVTTHLITHHSSFITQYMSSPHEWKVNLLTDLVNMRHLDTNMDYELNEYFFEKISDVSRVYLSANHSIVLHHITFVDRPHVGWSCVETESTTALFDYSQVHEFMTDTGQLF